MMRYRPIVPIGVFGPLVQLRIERGAY
jgi:hypothetical protein